MRQPVIELENLSVRLAGSDILKGISLHIDEGAYVSIIGPNGAGKTTLVKCLAGIHRNWTGTVRIGGRPFASHGAKGLARLQSYVPQAEGRGSPLTVEAFVAMSRYPYLSPFAPLRQEDHAAIGQALERAGLGERRHRKMNTLSGGERQMALIAAALAQGAKILLLDEPSTFLDYRHQADVARLLATACRADGITVVAVHHDINTATSCSDRIHALKDGALVFDGTPAEALGGDVLESVYGTGFLRVPDPRRPLLPYALPGGPPS